LYDWALALEPAAAFLFLLPFVVALAGLIQYALEERDKRAREELPLVQPKPRA
jgi:hypothetical protein